MHLVGDPRLNLEFFEKTNSRNFDFLSKFREIAQKSQNTHQMLEKL